MHLEKLDLKPNCEQWCHHLLCLLMGMFVINCFTVSFLFRYSYYSMAGLQTKVGQYEREVQQLRRALLRSDNYIEDLTSKLETTTGQSVSKNKRTHLRSSPAPSSSSCTITSLVDDNDSTHNTSTSNNTDVHDTEKSDLPEDASLVVDDSNQKKRSSTNDDSENHTSNCHSPVLGPVGNERFSLEPGTALGEERESPLGSRRSSEVSLYGQDLEIPPGPLTSSLNILEPVEGEALDRPPSRGELLLLGDHSSKRQEKPSLEENLNMFTASRQLMMLSERRQRHREGLEPSKMQDLMEYSPGSSDGGKRKSPDTKSIDFDVLVSAGGDDSPNNAASQESPSNLCRDEHGNRESLGLHTFSLAKIKSEIQMSHEDEIPPKKPRLENSEFGNDAENDEQENSS